MRGKTTLYGNLYGITKESGAAFSPYRFRKFSNTSEATTSVKATKNRIFDLCKRILWPGTEVEFNTLPKTINIANRLLLIERSKATQMQIQACKINKGY